MIDLLVTGVEFLFFTVVVKVIVAHWLADQIVKYGKKYASHTERQLAIWTHYQKRAAKQGHQDKSVLECEEPECAVFRIAPGSQASLSTSQSS